MGRFAGFAHMDVKKSRRMNKAGTEIEYRSVLLRRTYRQGGKVNHQALAKLAALPDHPVDTRR